MKKYRLIVHDITGENDNIVKGFAAAEERAKALLDEYKHDYPDCYVACFEEDEAMYVDDFMVFCRDCYGDEYWMMMVMGSWTPLHTRLLESYEEDELEELRNEVEKHISDLNETELKTLRSEICVGSIFLKDYVNSFDIDELEVSNVCDCYEEYLCHDEDGNSLPEKEWKQDTQDEFSNFCINYLY